MLHRSTSALYLVYLSALAVGFPISSSSHNTKDSTRTELLDAGQNERTVTTEPITSTTADSPGNNIKGSYSEPSAALTSPDKSSEPVVDSGDRTRVEYGQNMASLNYFQTLLLSMLQPKPIVDTIREEDKYGNDGEQLGQVGRSIVGGVEKVTNFLSSAVDLPYDILKSFTRKATEKLNNIGSKIVGL
ncbi:uncharacterized protein LOC110829571 [Zootermopsis nevadensis]|uniref:Uncharacterized protein n=1 Tax=Zootermopsis nevadensis TaxID=136037 RepID=A0A067R8N6_ZOONE|nr:uncharacterized protein LOC110829571 [Zootermopsis nevadensis]KDR19842.1 hypothetical protein L798_05908 [Zootermopsis nevadensis]